MTFSLPPTPSKTCRLHVGVRRVSLVNEVMHKQGLCSICVMLKLFPNVSIILERNCGFRTGFRAECHLGVHSLAPYQYPINPSLPGFSIHWSSLPGSMISVAVAMP